MKVILQNAVTLNGFIAGKRHATGWISAQDWRSFLRLVNNAGVMIVGRTTHDLMRKSGEYKKFSKILTVVLTKNPKLAREQNRLIVTTQAPKQIIANLRKRGFKKAVVAGGGKLNTAFMRAGVVNELFVDVHPILIGQGTPICAPAAFTRKLKLLSCRKISKEVLQLHYRVMG